MNRNQCSASTVTGIPIHLRVYMTGKIAPMHMRQVLPRLLLSDEKTGVVTTCYLGILTSILF